MLSIGFLFCLILDSEIPMMSTLTMVDENTVYNSGKLSGKKIIWLSLRLEK